MSSELVAIHITVPDFVDKISNVDISDLSPAQIDGLKQIFTKLGPKDATGAEYPFTMSNGAAHELLDIFDNLDKIQDIQPPVKVAALNNVDLNRVYDYTIKVGDEIIYVDKKAWAANTIKKWLSASANGKTKITGEVETGQLFRDLAAAGGNPPKKMLWSFDARANELGVDEIKKLIRKGFEDNFDQIAKAGGFDVNVRDSKAVAEKIDEVMGRFEVVIGQY